MKEKVIVHHSLWFKPNEPLFFSSILLDKSIVLFCSFSLSLSLWVEAWPTGLANKRFHLHSPTPLNLIDLEHR